MRIRRCSSANLGSGTARKRDSRADSAAESRKPKIGVEGGTWAPSGPVVRRTKTRGKRDTRSRRIVRRVVYMMTFPISGAVHTRNCRQGSGWHSSDSCYRPALHCLKMRRVSVSLPDDLAKALVRFQRSQRTQPPMSAILRDAIREFLRKKGFLSQFKIMPSGKRSGRSDVSRNHDLYFAGLLK